MRYAISGQSLYLQVAGAHTALDGPPTEPLQFRLHLRSVASIDAAGNLPGRGRCLAARQMCRTDVRNEASSATKRLSGVPFFKGRHRCPASPFAQSLEPSSRPPDVTAQVVVSASIDTQRDDWRCPECTTAPCPYCKTSVLNRCKHVVASFTDDGGWNYSPFEHAPACGARRTPGHRTGREGLARVFGKECGDAIADAYTDYGDLIERPEWEHERRLFLLMIDRQRLECDCSSWEVAHWFTSSHGTDYFSQERERIVAGIKTQVAWLAEGLERLFTILRGRQNRPTAFRSAAPDDPIYQEGWTVFTPQGFRTPSDLPGAKTSRKRSPAADRPSRRETMKG